MLESAACFIFGMLNNKFSLLMQRDVDADFNFATGL